MNLTPEQEKALCEFAKDTIKCTYKLGTTEPNPHHKLPFNPHPKKIMDDVLDTIGNTPLIRLNRIPQSEGVKCEVLVKVEFFNPGGSVKDRIGKRMVLEAERTGRIKKGDTIIEPTSGNTGIGLALCAAVRGYKMVITLPDKMSDEKANLLSELGAEVVRTRSEAPWASAESHNGTAQRLNKEIPNSHILDQYSNPDNPLSHYDGTAEEILYQTDGKVDVVVCTPGTGGTTTGIGRKFREVLPNCKIVGIDPTGSILALPKELNGRGLSPWTVEGNGQNHVPRVFDRTLVDEFMKVTDEQSFIMNRRMMKEEGLLIGGSAGSCVYGAIQYAKKYNLPEGTRMVVMLPDGVRNYMTKQLSKDWMIECKYLPLSEYDDPKHKLHGMGFDLLKLESVPYFDNTITVNQALEQFKKGARGIPIVNNATKKVERVLFENKLLALIVKRGLKGEDLAFPGSSREFSSFPSSITLTQLQRLLERNLVVFVEQLGEDGNLTLFAPTMKDIIGFLI